MTSMEIIKLYTTGKIKLEDANAELANAGSGLRLDPAKNVITEEDLRSTTIGYYPDMANGVGMLDTGTGSLDKVTVTNGRLDHAINQVLPDGSVNMLAYVYMGGRCYEVKGDTLTGGAD